MSTTTSANPRSPLEDARFYTSQRAWRMIPVPFREKEANTPGWQKLRLGVDDLHKHFGTGAVNVGRLNGEPSGWHVDADLDVPEAVEAAAELMPPTDLIHGRPGNPRSHYHYRSPGCKTKQYKDPTDGATLADFPFVDDASRANAWALLLTPILRPAIAGGVPLALLDAPSPGSGKTLYCAVVAVVATGQAAGILTAPQHDELEWRKRITAALRHGRPIVQIDNLAEELRSAQLAAALTCETWEDRELGYSRLLRLPQRATWMATGNNVKLGGDLPRRCYMTRLNTKLANPWERPESAFRHPKLLRWIAEHRGEIVAALLTIIRGWIVAGRPLPKDPPALGSFEEWASICAGVLGFAGVGEFLGNRVELYDRAAEEANQWQGFLDALRETWPDGLPFTAALVVRALGEEDQQLLAALPDALAVALASGKDGAFSVKLGRAFAQHADQRFGPLGVRLEQTGEREHNTVVWCVVVGD